MALYEDSLAIYIEFWFNRGKHRRRAGSSSGLSLGDYVAQLDFEAARQYALERLQRELSPDLFYHSLAHTRDDVVPAVLRLAASEGITGEELTLLLTAAYYHDLGYIEVYGDHECSGIRIALATLPGFGYQPAQLEVIEAVILATRLPQTPVNRLAEIMADGDLDVLGRPDFFERSELLRLELAGQGKPHSHASWQREQLAFLRTHHYFTEAAHSLRAAGKQANMERLARQVRIMNGSRKGAAYEP